MGEVLFPLIPYLIMLTFVTAVTWGVLVHILFDHSKAMNSLLGQFAAGFGVAWVACMALLGFCTLVQQPWETVYVPVTHETVRWGYILTFANAIAWAGPQVTGAALLGASWWVWKRLVAKHFTYVRDTRWRGNAS